ncbi:DUF935 domain-containing protein [Sagittula salina]|uniref:DUF935 domain-containing protein n=1 Tax=Sagittula salina TaxID=2820268 RepID=A0A940MS11_9RHOB|nr:DUF935 domain-containing protein [Sagittula salina]MBP0483952.1 DUF935 domain-containing protein [Sagittula salina]
MARDTQLLDQWGRPVKRAVLTQEVAGPTLGGVRSPLTGSPGDGLNPRRLAQILREAETGDPLRYLELAEIIEERDLHYVGVLGTRRRSVTGLDISVEDASADPIDVEAGKLIRDWVQREELQDEMFDILDAIGKGYSFTEIIWDRSMGQFMPTRLEWRDPRWFRFDRRDLRTPMMLDEHGPEVPLPAFKFITAQIRAKSGIPARGGLARPVTWAYLFKKFTERDWAIFVQTYGQPLRLGKYPTGASEEDRRTLFRAVANIAGDCAGIVPEGVEIEFIQTGQVSSSVQLYEQRADWLDKQVSKAVLGQTATTDAVTGGLGSGAEHRLVQEDIERADAKALAAAINRDLIRPIVDLNFPGHGRYPRVVIARPEAEDVTAWMQNVDTAVGLGLSVAEDDVYAKLGLRRPAEGARTLSKSAAIPSPEQSAPRVGTANDLQRPVKHPLNTQEALTASQGPATGVGKPQPRPEPIVPMADRMEAEAAPIIGRMLSRIEHLVAGAETLEEARDIILGAFPEIPVEDLTAFFAGGFAAAELGGRAEVAE